MADAPEMKRFFDDLEECWVGHVSVWLRNATGKMKVDGLVLEEMK